MKELLEAFKRRDKDGVVQELQAQLESVREWLQEHGEWALLVGILAGVVFVLFFKVIILLIVLGGLASYVIWQLTLEPKATDFSPDNEMIERFAAQNASAEPEEPANSTVSNTTVQPDEANNTQSGSKAVSPTGSVEETVEETKTNGVLVNSDGSEKNI